MTSTDTAGHPDVGEISDLAEGLLPPSRSADIRQHLDVCELCADVHASLEEIRGLLGTLPGPTRMPADVAGRIDAALAAEALLNAALPDSTETPAATAPARSTAPEPLEPSPPNAHESPGAAPDEATAGDKRAHVSRETAAPAHCPAGHARAATTGPGRKNGRRVGRRRAAVLGAVFAAAVLGLGSVLISTLGDGKPSDNTAHGQRSTASDAFSKGKLEHQVATLLAQNENTGDASRTPRNFGVESAPSGNEPKVFRAPAVPACVREGIGRDDTALAAEEGTYQGTEAMLVVLPDPADATRVIAYVVEATCVDQPSAGAEAKVLLKETYLRS